MPTVRKLDHSTALVVCMCVYALVCAHEYVCEYVCRHTCATANGWRSQDNLLEWVLSVKWVPETTLMSSGLAESISVTPFSGPMPGFHMIGVLNLAFHVCKASSVQTEPSC